MLSQPWMQFWWLQIHGLFTLCDILWCECVTCWWSNQHAEEGRCREGEFCENAIWTTMSYRAESRQDQNQVNKQGKVRKSSTQGPRGPWICQMWLEGPACPEHADIVSVCRLVMLGEWNTVCDLNNTPVMMADGSECRRGSRAVGARVPCWCRWRVLPSLWMSAWGLLTNLRPFSNHALRYLPKEVENLCLHKNLQKGVHRVLFIIAQTWK